MERVRQGCESNGKLSSLRLRISPSFDSLNVGSAPLVIIIDNALRLRVVPYSYARLPRRSEPCPADSFRTILPSRIRRAARQSLRILVGQPVERKENVGSLKADIVLKMLTLAYVSQAKRLCHVVVETSSYPHSLLILTELSLK
jgi:hypothetical protein